jgi:CheY-like chemotaxis protein
MLFVNVPPPSPDADNRETPSFTGATPVKRCPILVVDDHPDSVAVLERLLQMEGHEVRTAANGMDALKTVSGFHPRIVILDLGMPKLDGYDACAIIRNFPWGKEAVIIALTGQTEEEARKRSAKVGFDHHLTKPVEMAALRAIIAQAETEG